MFEFLKRLHLLCDWKESVRPAREEDYKEGIALEGTVKVRRCCDHRCRRVQVYRYDFSGVVPESQGWVDSETE